MSFRSALPGLLVLAGAAALSVPAHAQDATEVAVARIELTGASDSMNVGDSLQLRATAYDSAGHAVEVPIVYFSSARRALGVDRSTGMVKAFKPGPNRITAVVLSDRQNVRGTVSITVRFPPIRTVAIDLPGRMYAGTSAQAGTRVTDASGADRQMSSIAWSSSNRRVAEVSPYGEVTVVRPGQTTISAVAGGVTGSTRLTVVANPARTLLLTSSSDSARTGDVLRFTATALDAGGRPIADYPITYAVRSAVEDTVIAPGAPAQIESDGRFVAERAGLYTVIATGGSLVARKTVAIGHRFNSARIASSVGQGQVHDVHTSDIWVWTGKDGRDYAITGTWGGKGVAYFWDVTDPAAPVKTDSIQVDARTVNDVKVDTERSLCFITREGASNRKNGFLVLDCSDPRHVSVLSTFDDGLYGGVHNIFYWNKHLFPINAGTRFDIISVEDPRNPRRVGTFELDTPGHGIHDVWVEDGIAYSSNWADGVVLIDVGNGAAGGTPSHPVKMGQYHYPIGATHSAFPFHSRSTGKFYVMVGDEQFPYGLDPDDASQGEAGGYIHIVDFSDLKAPKEVARYQIPEAGPHNFWVQNDTLYVAYYNAGLRVVDISGELMGNLYTQGRELARFEAFDPQGKVPNTPMAWGPQPHKGHVFFTDFNSGLWSVKLPERKPAGEATP